jgi:hypothetical protein
MMVGQQGNAMAFPKQVRDRDRIRDLNRETIIASDGD